MNKTLEYLTKIKAIAEKEGLDIQITILNQIENSDQTEINKHKKCAFSQSPLLFKRSQPTVSPWAWHHSASCALRDLVRFV